MFLEELALCDNAGVAMGITVQTDMATPALARFGSEELKEKFLSNVSNDAIPHIVHQIILAIIGRSLQRSNSQNR